jgi:hypothetical protein
LFYNHTSQLPYFSICSRVSPATAATVVCKSLRPLRLLLETSYVTAARKPSTWLPKSLCRPPTWAWPRSKCPITAVQSSSSTIRRKFTDTLLCWLQGRGGYGS